MTTRKPVHGQDPHEPHAARRPGAEELSEAHLVERVAELEAALAEAKDRHLRMAADFDNFKKRSRQEREDTIRHASVELISRLLPAIDDLRQALADQPAGIEQAWVKGLELSVRKLEDALGAHGLEPIEAVGSRFDPTQHEAIGHEESADLPEDTVVRQLRRGYRIRDRVLRPALVKVARPPVRADEAGDAVDLEPAGE